MTVIAAMYDSRTRSGWMAADSISTDGLGIQRRTEPKVRVVQVSPGEQWLLGVAGSPLLLRGVDLTPQESIEAWLWSICDQIQANAKERGHTGDTSTGVLCHDVQLLAVSQDGLWVADSAVDVHQVQQMGHQAYAAVGSGREIALGALYIQAMGHLEVKDVQYAVKDAARAACRFAASCAGPIQLEGTGSGQP